jgi:hypothetical protein
MRSSVCCCLRSSGAMRPASDLPILWCERFRQALSRRDETLCKALHRVHQGSGCRRRVRLQYGSFSGRCRPWRTSNPKRLLSDELTDEQPIRSGSVAGLLADQRVALLACGMQRPPAGGWSHRVLAITRRCVTRGTGQSRHRRPESAAFARAFSRCRDPADPLVIREFRGGSGVRLRTYFGADRRDSSALSSDRSAA